MGASMADRRCDLCGCLMALLLVIVLAGCNAPAAQQGAAGFDGAVDDAEGGRARACHGAGDQGSVLPPPPPSGKYPVVIDPWIDVTTGDQVATTKLMQQELETLAPQHFPQLELLPFTPESLARKPVVLLGADCAGCRAGCRRSGDRTSGRLSSLWRACGSGVGEDRLGRWRMGSAGGYRSDTDGILSRQPGLAGGRKRRRLFADAASQSRRADRSRLSGQPPGRGTDHHRQHGIWPG